MNAPQTDTAPPAWAPAPAPVPEVARGRVSDALDAAVSRRVVTVTAPAGAGKSMAVAAWLRRLPPMVPRAHLRLDHVDGDFASAVSAACTPLPGGAAGILVMDEAAGAPSAVRAHAAAWTENAPPSMRVVWISRAVPPLPRARLLARGELAEIGMGLLRFTADEAAALVQASGGGELALEAAHRLATLVDGWATGVRLAAHALAGGADAGSFLDRAQDGWADVREFFDGEVLAPLSADSRNLLSRAALLPRLSGPALDAAAAGTGGGAMLAAAARDGLFIEAVDERPGEYRMHPLFAAALRSAFAQGAPDDAAACRRRAAAWYQSTDCLPEAAGLWLAAGDGCAAARVVARLLPTLIARGDAGRLGAWLEALPPAALRDDPRLAVGRAWALFGAGEASAVEPLLRQAEAADDPSGEVAALALAVRAQVSLFSRRSADGIAQGMEALRQVDAGDRELRAAILSTVSVGSVGVGDTAGARRALNEALSVSGRAGDAEALQPLLFAAWRATQEGDLGEGERLYERGRVLAEPPGAEPLAGAAMARSGLADIAYERDDLDGAARHVDAALRLARAERNAQAELTAGFTLARLLRARGDGPGALRAVRDALRSAPHLVAMHGFVEALEAECLAFAGEAEAALAWVRALPESAGSHDEFDVIHQARRLSAARILLHLGQPSDAARWLPPSPAVAPGVFGVALLATRAAALAGMGDDEPARAAARDATRLASRHGYVRSLVDTGDALAPLVAGLMRAPGADAEPAWVRHLARVNDALLRQRAIWGSPRDAAPVSPKERLTGREQQVLQLAGAGLSNKGIAARLGSSPATVKKQLLSIFAKLNARSRTHAVLRGRELGLLE